MKAKAATRVSLTFGPLSPKLRRQLERQGFYMDISWVAAYQKDSDAITWLYNRGLLSERAVDAARNTVGRRITAALPTRCPPEGKASEDRHD